MPAAESALVVLAAAAEDLVSAFRERYDPVARAGMPAHITCLYPFLEPAAVDASVGETLQDCLARIAPFGFALAEVRSFRAPEAVLYLAPDTDAPFRALTEAICARFPPLRPYGGRHADVVPHLTVAHLRRGRDFQKIVEEFEAICAGRLPIHTAVSDVALMDNTEGRWRVRQSFPLGRG